MADVSPAIQPPCLFVAGMQCEPLVSTDQQQAQSPRMLSPQSFSVPAHPSLPRPAVLPPPTNAASPRTPVSSMLDAASPNTPVASMIDDLQHEPTSSTQAWRQTQASQQDPSMSRPISVPAHLQLPSAAPLPSPTRTACPSSSAIDQLQHLPGASAKRFQKSQAPHREANTMQPFVMDAPLPLLAPARLPPPSHDTLPEATQLTLNSTSLQHTLPPAAPLPSPMESASQELKPAKLESFQCSPPVLDRLYSSASSKALDIAGADSTPSCNASAALGATGLPEPGLLMQAADMSALQSSQGAMLSTRGLGLLPTADAPSAAQVRRHDMVWAGEHTKDSLRKLSDPISKETKARTSKESKVRI
jgi:hypothetical protein